MLLKLLERQSPGEAFEKCWCSCRGSQSRVVSLCEYDAGA